MFTRIAVVNRGEPVMRFIRAVRELNEEHGRGIKVIALHTEAEQRALFVRSADESVCLRDVAAPGLVEITDGEHKGKFFKQLLLPLLPQRGGEDQEHPAAALGCRRDATAPARPTPLRAISRSVLSASAVSRARTARPA